MKQKAKQGKLAISEGGSRLAIVLACLSVANGLRTPTLGFVGADQSGGSFHGQITRDALEKEISEPNLKLVVEANDRQDKPGSDEAKEMRRHFADAHFSASLGYIDREKKRSLNYAAEADTDAESRGLALSHFGEMLHVVQDFYSRTNYIELMLKNPTYKADPYSIPLVDWMKMPDGYPGLSTDGALTDGAHRSEGSLSKDSPNYPSGKKVIHGNVSQFNVARELAVRETQRQWSSFQAMIKGRCGMRSPQVLAALKEASPEKRSSNEGPLD